MSTLPRAPRAHQSGTRKPRPPVHGTARLTLFVNGTAYNVRPIAVDPSLASQAYRLRKADGTTYTVAMTEYGGSCTCGDYVFHRDGLDPTGCKHIKAMIAVGLIGKGGAR